MTLYSGSGCHFSQRCRIVLYEKGMDFEIIDIDLENKPEDLAIMNPYNRTPVLVERDLILFESNIINEIVSEIHQNKIDHLMYSFYHKGDLLKQLKLIPHNKKNFISYADLSFENYEKIKLWHLSNNIIPDYLISLCSFMSLEFLKRNLQVSKHNKKYNKMLPFNFEKSFKEKEIIPFKAGFLNKELFVSIDDDHGEKGYSLISRGLYQNRKTKAEMDMIRNKKIKIYKESIIRKIIKKLNIFK